MTPDYSPVENLRLEMLSKQHAKEEAIRKEAAELSARADQLDHEGRQASAFKEGDADAVRRSIQLREESTELRKRAHDLLHLDLPREQQVTAHIGGGNHADLINLTTSIFSKFSSDLSEQNRKVANELAAARAAWNEHIAKIASKKTFELAERLAAAFAAANKAQNARLDETVATLLASTEPVAA